jgi:hypothetical protein
MNGVVIPTRPVHTTCRTRRKLSREQHLAQVLDYQPITPAPAQAARPVHVDDRLARMRQGERGGAGEGCDGNARERHSLIEADNLALDRIEIQPKLSQFPGGIGQRTFGTRPVVNRDGDVVRVPHSPVAERQHGPVERIEVQVAQQRRQRTALVKAQAAVSPRGPLTNDRTVHEPAHEVNDRHVGHRLP